MSYYTALGVQGTYARRMMLIIRTVLSSVPLVSLPVLAADADIETGITSVGPSMFIFTIAIALILTLVFRATAGRLATVLTSRLGRFRVRRTLARHSKAVLRDAILPGAYGGLAKIDYAALTAAGIVCIRTVHCNGVISGTDDEAQWTNIDGVSRRRFLNPMIQNEGRVRAVQKLVPDAPVTSLVVFTGAVEFSSPPPANVIRVDQLSTRIQEHARSAGQIDEPDRYWSSLQAHIMSDLDTRKDFAAQISFS